MATIYGLDQLGGARYADLAAREQPAGWGFGVFTNVQGFGKADALIETVARQGRAAFQRLNLAWSDTHSFPASSFEFSVREARRLAPIIKKYPGMKWYVSGATEHKLQAPQARRLAEMVMAQLPSVVDYVNNPWEGNGDFLPGVVNEVHGKKAQRPKIGGRFAFSCDGSDCFDFDIEGKKRDMAGAEYFMWWCAQFNGNRKAEFGKDETKPPRDKRRHFPTPELIDATIYLRHSLGDVRLPKRYLVKPKADGQEPKNARDYKPVLIIPPNVKRVELLADNGQVVAASRGPEPFADGRFRYYFDSYGFQISEKAIRIHGKPQVNVSVGGKVVGSCNMAFRYGEFR